MGLLESVVVLMQELDLFRIGFPFLLVLSISYGVLNRTDFFDENSVQAVASLAVSFISIGGIYFFVPQGLILGAMAAVVIALVSAFAFIVIIGLSGGDAEEALEQTDLPVKNIAVPIALVGLLGSIIYFVPILQFIPGVTDENVISGLVQPLIIILVIGGLIFAFTQADQQEEEEE